MFDNSNSLTGIDHWHIVIFTKNSWLFKTVVTVVEETFLKAEDIHWIVSKTLTHSASSHADLYLSIHNEIFLKTYCIQDLIQDLSNWNSIWWQKKLVLCYLITKLKCNIALSKNKSTFLLCFPTIKCRQPFGYYFMSSRPTCLNNTSRSVYTRINFFKTSRFSSFAYYSRCFRFTYHVDI